MSSSPSKVGDLFVGWRRGKQGRRIIRFVELFNQPSAEPVADQSLERYAAVARSAVMAEILHPESARFDWTLVRQCGDGMIRAAGSVHLDGSDGSRTDRWYLVEFFRPAQAELLDLIDRDPVSLKLIPVDQWEGDVLRYARPGTAQGRRFASLARRLLWPAIILFCAAVIAKILS